MAGGDVIDDRDRPTPEWELPPEPAIHRAARKGDVSELARLLASGADINAWTNLEIDNGPHLRKLTPLMVAARSIDGASVETLRWLVDHGADVKAKSEGGNTAAWYAAGHGARWEFHKKAVTPDHTERLRFLLDCGCDAGETNFIGRSLLTEACEAGDASRVRLLLERGAKATPNNPTGLGPTSRKSSFLRHGIGGGANDPDVPKGTLDSFSIPIFSAAQSGSAACVRLLLDAGANPNERDSGGATPLMVSGSGEVARLLIGAGSERDATDEFGKDALEMVLNEWCCGGVCGPARFEVVKALIDAGAEVERVDQFGMTRLASAAFGHHDDAVAFLLKAGADPRAEDREGGTALHGICWKGNYDAPEMNNACGRIIELLVAAGVDPNAKDSDASTPMHKAAAGDWGNQTAVRTLLRFGGVPDQPDAHGVTPLMAAADRGEVECIRLLLQAGADPLRRDTAGQSAIDRARDFVATWEEMDPGVSAEVAKTIRDMTESMLKDQFGDAKSDFGLDVIEKSMASNDSTLRKAREALALLENPVKFDQP